MNKLNAEFDKHIAEVPHGTVRQHFEAGYFAGQNNAALEIAEMLDEVNPVAANLIREDVADEHSYRKAIS